MHYLPSLQRAHELEQCTNFKDPGIQFYGGQLFHSVSERADEMFCTLPPPIPSQRTSVHSTPPARSRPSNAYPPTVSSMSVYHCASAPCFHGSCLVTLADGTMKRVDQIQSGDFVICPSSTRQFPSSESIIAQVQSIIRTFSSSGSMNLVSLQSGLLVTPWHPIKSQNKWTFPATLLNSDETRYEPIKTEAVYSFLLGPELNFQTFERINPNEMNRGQSMMINEVECITLAHGILDDPVASHTFYATEDVVRAMTKKGISREGYVDLYEGDVIKDPVTNLAIGFRM